MTPSPPPGRRSSPPSQAPASPTKGATRLLANTIAHQWWGSEVSPATLSDAWITNGMSRYGELMYLEDDNGKSALQSALSDVSAGALAYDTVPLSTIGRLDPFSPQFQSMTLEKGAMIFHMLRWEIGDKAFLNFLRGMLSQYTDKCIRIRRPRESSRSANAQELTSFFAQWVEGTGAPAFTNKYSVYRLGNNKGFRTIGQINEDLDLFRMPVELRVETDGKTEDHRIDVFGTDSNYTVDTFGRPRRIQIDPGNWVLKSTPDLQVRIAILSGQQLVAQGDLTGALAEYQKALAANQHSSLATYRIGESSSSSATTSPPSTVSATPSAATTTRAGPRSGATSTSATSSTSPASATAPSTSTASPSRPTTTPRAPSTKLAPACRPPTNARPKTSRTTH